jgi:hypothetical protein
MWDVNYLYPRHCCISYRLYLAAMHFNENGNRAQATNKDGEKSWSLNHPKAHKGNVSVVKPRKVAPTFGML